MPFVLGTVCPRIYLPAGLDATQRRHILLHESAHLRHGDPILRPIFYLAACVHWFNPFAWLAFGCMRREGEESCDEAVLRAIGEAGKRSYCESLLRAAVPVRGACASFGEGSVKMRVQHILRYKTPSRRAVLGGAALALVVGFACLTGCGAASDSASAAELDRSDAASAGPIATVEAEPETSAERSAPAEEAAASAAAVVAVTPDDLIWPVPDYSSVSQTFGENHNGVDIAADQGTDILAAADGTVCTAEYSGLNGQYIVLDHGNGLKTMYLHCASLNVKPGQTVTQGQKIAEVGSTGRSTGPHCHYEVLQGEDALPVDEPNGT
jgi:murein DD-endopeptidase MepM/ murein hydrolase activator NlpD